MTTKKYYIKRVHGKTIEYKRYKCIGGWSKDKSCCWNFSKNGATRIIEREQNSIHPSQRSNYEFSIEEV